MNSGTALRSLPYGLEPVYPSVAYICNAQQGGKRPDALEGARPGPAVIDDVQRGVSGIGRNSGAKRRVVVPDLHVGRDPHRQRLVAGPGERLALGDEGIVVTVRPAHRL